MIESVAGKSILFVMAVDAEYGPHLQRLISPFMTGVGPVESGVAMGAELARLHTQNALPDLVVSLGSAGSDSAYGTFSTESQPAASLCTWACIRW